MVVPADLVGVIDMLMDCNWFLGFSYVFGLLNWFTAFVVGCVPDLLVTC